MGVGMVLVVSQEELSRVKEVLDNKGEKFYELGKITKVMKV